MVAVVSRRASFFVVVCLATALAFNAPSSKVPPKPRKVARTHARAGAKAVRASGGEVERRRLVRGYLSVAGGVCAHIMLGTMYCWGNYLSYVTPSLRFFDGVDRPGVTPDAVQVLPIMIVFQALALSLGAKLDKAWGARATTLIGCLVLIAGTWLSSYCTRLLPFILVYSVCGGAGAGIAYTAPMYAGGSWFPNSRGLINGLTLFGFGSGAFFFNKVATRFAQAGLAWDEMLRRLAGLYALVGVTGSLLVQRNPDFDRPRAARLWSPSWWRANAEGVGGAGFREAARSRRLRALWLVGFLAFAPGHTVIGLYKRFGESDAAAVVNDDAFLSMVGGLSCVWGGLGRLAFGRLIDLYGFQRSWHATTLLQILNMLALPLTLRSRAAFLAVVCSCIFCLGGSNAMYVTVTPQLFGSRNAGEIFSVLFSAVALGSLFGARLAMACVPTVGWAGVFRVLAGLCSLNFFVLKLLRDVVAENRCGKSWAEAQPE